MKKKLQLKPGDFIILILILAAGIFLTFKPHKLNTDKILVQTENASYEYPLKKDAVYDFEGPLGTTKVEVKNGKVHIIDSPCPNKICINQGFSNTIICLPNKIIVTVQTEGDFDALAE